jgi:hypothetical protein
MVLASNAVSWKEGEKKVVVAHLTQPQACPATISVAPVVIVNAWLWFRTIT